ncbi:MAG TPA: TRAP transporter TatT component family protein [Treponemataceae bacterium]|nr:TRAP transporter TatT component family protein [Treponemataceae bacterium]HPS43689.1 TRAP transporter TatT component family protein [Treponemataceae bacterium]
MKKNLLGLGVLACIAALGLSGCTAIKQAGMNGVSNMLAPADPVLQKKSASDPDPMIALTGENDPELVGDFFPTALKLYEMMHLQNPKHEGLSIMTGQLYVMYAAAFVQGPAERLPLDRFDEQDAAYRRAQNFYLRGRGYVLEGLDHRYKGFSAAVFGSDEGAMRATLARCKKVDAAALYWAGSGALGAFSLSPLEASYGPMIPGSVAMLERASELDPSFNSGAIWEVLMSFYAAAPDSLGGGKDKAIAAYNKALEVSGGKTPGPYIAYARFFCVPAQDGAGFDEYIEKALAIDPDSQPENRLALTIAHRQAAWLKEHKADFILE